MQNGPTLPKQHLNIFVQATTLWNKGLTKICEKWVPFIWQRQKTNKNKQKETDKKNKQRAKIIVHLKNGTCRKFMPYHQDPDLFHRNHSTVKNIFT